MTLAKSIARWRSISVPVVLSLLVTLILHCDAAGLRGKEDTRWRSSLMNDNNTNDSDSDTNSTATLPHHHHQELARQAAVRPLVCELNSLRNESECSARIGDEHPGTPVCLYSDATGDYTTVCMETSSDFVARLDHPHRRSYCGSCHECFQTKQELQTAVHKYKSHTQVDLDLALRYGWPISNWCTAPSVQDFSNLFFRSPKFNEDLSRWDTGHVTDMTSMFQNAFAFNQPLNGWDTSRVTSMARMFAMAVHFDQPLDTWDVSNVEDMGYMFLHALQFNQDLSQWQVHNAYSLNSMFFGATQFQYDLSRVWVIDKEADTSNMCQWPPPTSSSLMEELEQVEE